MEFVPAVMKKVHAGVARLEQDESNDAEWLARRCLKGQKSALHERALQRKRVEINCIKSNPCLLCDPHNGIKHISLAGN